MKFYTDEQVKVIESLLIVQLAAATYSGMEVIQEKLKAALAILDQGKEVEVVGIVGSQTDTWKGYAGGWIPPGEPLKVAHFFKDVPISTSLHAIKETP